MTDTQNVDKDIIKFAYDKFYDELNRCRDWPMKAVTLNSVLNVILVGFIKLGDQNSHLRAQSKCLLLVALVIFSISTIYIIINNHLQYLKYRNIQIRLQGMLEFYNWTWKDKKVIDEEFAEQTEINIFKRWKGWLYHVIYVIVLTFVVAILIWQTKSGT